MRRLGLRTRFLLFAVPLTLAVILTFHYVMVAEMRQLVSASTKHEAEMTATSLAQSVVLQRALSEANDPVIEQELQRFATLTPNLEYLIVLDSRREVRASLLLEPAADVGRLIEQHSLVSSEQVSRPEHAITSRQGQPLGAILISVDGSTNYRNAIMPPIILGLVIPTIFLIAITIMFGVLFRRIRRMVRFAHSVATGDLGQTMPDPPGDELGVLARALNQMTQNLSGVVSQLGQVGQELTSVISRITETANGVADGSERQWTALEESRVEIDAMTGSQAETARHVASINAHAVQSTDDAKAIGASNEAVHLELERLSDAVSMLTASVEQVAGNITSMAQHVDVLSRASSESESAISRTGSALQSVRQLADDSHRTAEAVAQEAREGVAAVATSRRSIAELEEIMADVQQATNNLADRLVTVGGFLRAIADVARRTNLLSLNAAIIASQAGEQGRQFQVVAREVKALAGQTAGLTQDIEDVLGEVSEAGQNAVNAVEGASQAVTQGAVHTQRAGALFDHILVAVDRTAQASHDIAYAVADREADVGQVLQAAERVVAVTTEIQSVARNQVEAADIMRDATRTIAQISRAVGTSSEDQLTQSMRIGRALGDVFVAVDRLSKKQEEQDHRSQRVLSSVASVRKLASRNRGEAKALEVAIAVLVEQAEQMRAKLAKFKL